MKTTYLLQTPLHTHGVLNLGHAYLPGVRGRRDTARYATVLILLYSGLVGVQNLPEERVRKIIKILYSMCPLIYRYTGPGRHEK